MTFKSREGLKYHMIICNWYLIPVPIYPDIKTLVPEVGALVGAEALSINLPGIQ